MFPQLTTARCFLQQVLPHDQQFILEGLSHPDVIPFYGVRYDSIEATKAQIDWYDKMLEEGTGIGWKIVNKHTAENIGVLSSYFYKPEHNKAEVGFWLLPNYWNRGFASKH